MTQRICSDHPVEGSRGVFFKGCDASTQQEATGAMNDIIEFHATVSCEPFAPVDHLIPTREHLPIYLCVRASDTAQGTFCVCFTFFLSFL